MPAGDVTITATFKESIVNYNLTWSVTPAEGGTVEIKAGETVLTTSPAQVAAGTHITITPSPAQGYEVESVKVNGTPLLTIDDDETGGEFGAPALPRRHLSRLWHLWLRHGRGCRGSCYLQED